jgi:hypothetical protein
MLAACWQGWNWTRSSGREALITPSTLYNGGILVQFVPTCCKKAGLHCFWSYGCSAVWTRSFCVCAHTHAPLSLWGALSPPPSLSHWICCNFLNNVWPWNNRGPQAEVRLSGNDPNPITEKINFLSEAARATTIPGISYSCTSILHNIVIKILTYKQYVHYLGHKLSTCLQHVKLWHESETETKAPGGCTCWRLVM